MRYRTASAARGVLLVLALGLLHGCEFFLGTDVTTVDVPATFSVPLAVALPTQDQIDAAPLENGQRIVTMPAVYAPVDLVALVPELAEHDGNVNGVNVDEILHIVAPNTLNVTVRSIPIRVGPTTGTFETAELLSQTVPVPATTVQGEGVRADLIPLGQQLASDHMAALDFGLGTQISFAIPEGTTPSGAATMSLQFTVTVVASP